MIILFKKTRLIMDKSLEVLNTMHYELAKFLVDKIKSRKLAVQFLKDNGVCRK